MFVTDGSSAVVTYSTFAHNAQSGLWLTGGSTATIRQSTLDGNLNATSYGTAVTLQGSSLTIRASTLVEPPGAGRRRRALQGAHEPLWLGGGGGSSAPPPGIVARSITPHGAVQRTLASSGRPLVRASAARPPGGGAPLGRGPTAMTLAQGARAGSSRAAELATAAPAALPLASRHRSLLAGAGSLIALDASSTLSVGNSILSCPAASCIAPAAGLVIVQGSLLHGGWGTAADGNIDAAVAPPMLGPLSNNGGPTQTRVPLLGARSSQL